MRTCKVKYFTNFYFVTVILVMVQHNVINL